jgi:hypothetical protein
MINLIICDRFLAFYINQYLWVLIQVSLNCRGSSKVWMRSKIFTLHKVIIGLNAESLVQYWCWSFNQHLRIILLLLLLLLLCVRLSAVCTSRRPRLIWRWEHNSVESLNHFTVSFFQNGQVFYPVFFAKNGPCTSLDERRGLVMVMLRKILTKMSMSLRVKVSQCTGWRWCWNWDILYWTFLIFSNFIRKLASFIPRFAGQIEVYLRPLSYNPHIISV